MHNLKLESFQQLATRGASPTVMVNFSEGEKSAEVTVTVATDRDGITITVGSQTKQFEPQEDEAFWKLLNWCDERINWERLIPWAFSAMTAAFRAAF